MRMNFVNKTHFKLFSNHFKVLMNISVVTKYYTCTTYTDCMREIMDVCGPGSGSDLIEILIISDPKR